jgi:periplasmic protein TonB
METKNSSNLYGYHELRRLQQRFMSLAMTIAITLQLMIFGGYQLSERMQPEMETDGGFPFFDTIRVDRKPPPPPPIGPIIEDPTIIKTIAKIAKGIPTAVSNALEDTNKIFASQTQLSQEANMLYSQFGGNGMAIKPDQIDPPPEKFIPVEVNPTPILSPKPAYPDLGVKAGVDGNVIVRALLDQEGRVKRTMILKSTNEIFNQPAIDAAQNWVFTPALMNGQPVKVWVTIPFKFKLIQ